MTEVVKIGDIVNTEYFTDNSDEFALLTKSQSRDWKKNQEDKEV